jgi:hypothetical protein
MRTYFEKLSKIGVEAVQGLRRLDAQQAVMAQSYHEDYTKGTITRQGYERYLKELNTAREKYIAGVDAQIEGLKAEFAEATERHTTPTSGNMNMADVEILKNFELSPKEFESLARKYDNNATMGRMLEKYRVDHNVKTDWRFQTAERRNEIFNGACSSVQSIMGQLDKYCPAREANIERRTAAAYHKLQGSIAEVMPIPDDPTPAPGTTIHSDIKGATAVSNTGTVYTCF